MFSLGHNLLLLLMLLSWLWVLLKWGSLLAKEDTPWKRSFGEGGGRVAHALTIPASECFSSWQLTHPSEETRAGAIIRDVNFMCWPRRPSGSRGLGHGAVPFQTTQGMLGRKPPLDKVATKRLMQAFTGDNVHLQAVKNFTLRVISALKAPL